ncbi:PASTA domain-containing protein [Nocardioides sp. W3-2-3]|nr:PASTA domain-containing protein [Nocardioides convexus]
MEKTLEGRGLQVKVTDTEFSDTVPKGRVISHTPASGVVYKGDEIDLVVSKGPESVTVPSVRYSSTDSAVDKPGGPRVQGQEGAGEHLPLRLRGLGHRPGRGRSGAQGQHDRPLCRLIRRPGTRGARRCWRASPCSR